MLYQKFQPMILKKADVIPKGEYLHQFKWDGHRLLFHYNEGKVRLFTREMNECTIQYPEFQNIRLPVRNCILDGECVVLDPEGNPPLPCFEYVMTRFHARKDITIQKYMQTYPVHFAVWDILYLDDVPIHAKSLMERLELLNKIVTPNDVISVTPSYDDGEALFRNIVSIGAEGVVSKPKNGRYRFGSTTGKEAWLKIKNYQFETVQISGVRKKEFGWSLSHNGKYVGVLEFPPPIAERERFRQKFKSLVCGENTDWIFIEPILSCLVKFQSYTKDGKMRSPSFVSFD